MSPTERSQLLALFVGMSAYYGQEIPDSALKLYVDDLADLSFASVVAAMKALRRDPKVTRCPLPAVIRAKLTPESDPESEAVMLSSRIAGMVARLGPYRSSEARLALGNVAWAVVQMEGGWESLCQNLTYDNMPILKAQWRKLAKAIIERGGATEFDAPAITDQRGSVMTSIGDLLKRLPKPEGGP